MRKNFGPRPWLYPQPVLLVATYDENGVVDVMNAAWGGQGGMDTIVMDLTHTHKTVQNFEKTGAFTVGIADAASVVAADFVGIVSANDDPDKFAKTGWTAEKSELVNAPIINELPLTLECEFVRFDEDGRTVGKVLNVAAAERVLDENGEIDTAKVDAIIYEPVHHTYMTLGEVIAPAFKVGAKLK